MLRGVMRTGEIAIISDLIGVFYRLTLANKCVAETVSRVLEWQACRRSAAVGIISVTSRHYCDHTLESILCLNVISPSSEHKCGHVIENNGCYQQTLI